MNDNLEKFIKTHRDDLDDKEPPKDLWHKIAGDISSQEKFIPVSRSLVFWRVAAAILFLTTTTLLIDKFIRNESGSSQVTELSNPVLKEAEVYYLSLISQKMEEISDYGKNEYIDPRFTEDIERLDSVYQALKSELIQGNEQDIIDAMIQNLQLRIEVLSRQLEIIQSIENSKKENNESVNI